MVDMDSFRNSHRLSRIGLHIYYRGANLSDMQGFRIHIMGISPAAM